MKKIMFLYAIYFFFLNNNSESQTYNLNGTVNGTTITSCNATLYDSGGPSGTYQNSENYTVTFCSGTSDCLQLQLVSLNTESGYDYIYIHDGNSTAANLLATINGSTIPPNITTSGNCVTIHFTTDGSVTYSGFEISITCTGSCYVPPPPPSNDDPCSAFSLNVDSICNFTTYTCQNASGTTTVPVPSCSFTYSGGDVWFSAVVPASGSISVLLGAAGMSNAGIAIYTGANCNTLTEMICNETWSGMPPIQTLGGLAGQTIWIRVWDPYNDNPGSFNICTYIPPQPPSNDEPCTSAILNIDTVCNFTQFTCQSATGSTAVPIPGCSFSYMGGDVWFSAVVPSTGVIIQLGPGSMNNAGIAVYSGTNCNALTEIMCNEPPAGMSPSQLIGPGYAGQKIWIRIWEPNNDNPGTFDICAFIPPPPPPVNPACPNANFSSLDFTNWQGYTGTYTACCPTNGIVTGRHTIINTPGTDPNTGNALSLLPPGLSVSAQLGNSNVGAEAEQLRYNLTVDSLNSIFYYSFAVILEDPSHSAIEQPKFNIRVIDSLGNLVDSIYGFYSVVSGGSLPGFQSFGTTRWKDWSVVGIDLSPYAGQNISIEYSTYDCAQSGHFGYAYISCDCMFKGIEVEYNPGYTQAVLTAPPGFDYLWSPGGESTQTKTIINPVSGTTYTCILTAITGCTSTLTTTLDFNVGISNEFLLNENHVYPNPATSSTTIILPETDNNVNYTFSLYGINSQTIINREGTGKEIEINTRDLPGGVYMIKISTSTNHSYSSKLIVK